ncbi:hypothetical protein CL619_00390 [archaeon]|nr:hypothetical protein [archaeon]
MMKRDLLKFIFVSLFRRGLRSFLTIIGISIGIAAVVALIALSSGMQEGIQSEFQSLGADKLFVSASSAAFGPPGTSVTVPLTIDEKDGIADIDGVRMSIGRLLRYHLVEFDDQIETVPIVSIPIETEEIELMMESLSYDIVEGKMPNEDSNQVFVGSSLREKGFDVPLELRDTLLTNDVELEIVGISAKTGAPERDGLILSSETSMRDYLSIEDEFDLIIVQVEDENELPLVKERIENFLRDERSVEVGEEDFIVESPEALLETLGGILLIVQGVLVGIASIALVVGSVGIMNTMYTSVVERRKEIGILRSIGVKRGMIRWLFLIESGILGFLGGLLGIIIGATGAYVLVQIISPIVGSNLLQAHFSVTVMLFLLVLSTLVGAVSGYFPAREASKLTPLEALRT